MDESNVDYLVYGDIQLLSSWVCGGASLKRVQISMQECAYSSSCKLPTTAPHIIAFLLDLCGHVTCPWAVTCVMHYSGYIWRHLRERVWTCFICTFICGDMLAGGTKSHEPWLQSLIDWYLKVWQTVRAFSGGQSPINPITLQGQTVWTVNAAGSLSRVDRATICCVNPLMTR